MEPSAIPTNGRNWPLHSLAASRGAPLADKPRSPQRRAQATDRAVSLYLCEVGQVKGLKPQKELAVIARARRGDRRARERLIKANLRRVVEISREYENIGLPLLDLISEGNIGLLKAVERFEPRRGNRFSTFSAWWIRQSIKRALASQARTFPRRLDRGHQGGFLHCRVGGNTPVGSRAGSARRNDHALAPGIN